MKSRSRRDQDIRDELQFHLEAEQEELEAAGIPGKQARSAAARDLGNATLLAETLREVWSRKQIERLVMDLRYALRTMRRDRVSPLPPFSASCSASAPTPRYSVA